MNKYLSHWEKIRPLIIKISSSKFLKFGLLISTVNVLGGILGYAYQIVISHLLLPSEFAKFNAVMALSVFFGAPLSALVMILSKRVSTFKAHADLGRIKFFYIRVCKLMGCASIIAAIIFLALINTFQLYLKIEETWPIIIFGGILILGIFYAINNGFIQGMQWFVFYSSLGIVGIILKMAFSVIFIDVNYGISGALGGVLLSMVVILFSGSTGLLKNLPSIHSNAHAEPSFPVINFVKEAAPIVAANIAFVAITQLDMVYVNWFFPPLTAGYYAAASILGKAILYLPGGLILALFPMVSESHARNESSRHIFQQAIIVTIIVCGGMSAIYWVFAERIIALFYDPSYFPAVDILKWYGLAIFPVSLVLVAEQFLIAKGKILFAWLFLLIAPIQLLAVYFWHSEIWMVILIMGISGLALAGIGYVMMFRIIYKK
ncbi:hypothetical protein G6646_00150 [Polynucleobacter paneuropaeus]|nr:hypothetical protein [Polynucleobacter paneuropaeus]QWD09498.1 hypothetical protein G6713_01745 [Polynucleobacter paneuropaeus]